MAQAQHGHHVFWPRLTHRNLGAGINFSSHSTSTLTTTSSAVSIPMRVTDALTVTQCDVWLSAGESTAFRWRIVDADATTGLPTSTLAHANAEVSITATSGGWNVFTPTSFSLAIGDYWIVFDSTATPTVALALNFMQDYTFIVTDQPEATGRYWSGSAWTSLGARKALRARIKSSDGWLSIYPLAPLDGASGLNPIIMDTSENPACRGNRFIAPANGSIIGFDVSFGNFSDNTSFDLVLADEGCTTELARQEMRRARFTSVEGFCQVLIEAVTVVAGTAYDVYITPGSFAGATTGVYICALDTSEDSGNVIGCYGVTPGDVKGLSVNSPATEGGADVPTTTLDHVFLIVPVYGEITSSGGGGGGGETSHVFAS